MVKRLFIIALVGVVLMALLTEMGMAQEKRERRDPLLHGLASFVLPGLGQYLNGESDKALMHFLIAVALPVVCSIVAYIIPIPYHELRQRLCMLLQLGWHAYSAIDAYEIAKRSNTQYGFALALPQLTTALEGRR